MKFRSIYLLAAFPLLVGATMPLAFAGPQVGAFLAQAQGEKGKHGEMHQGDRHRRITETLGLSKDQVSQLEAIHDAGKNDSQAQYDALKTEMEAMQALVSESASANELRAKHQKIQSLKQAMGTERFETLLKMYEILTPEQRTKFAEKMKERGQRWGRQGHFRHHRGNDSEASGELQSMLVF
jgi:periplasmic protein CpxP/Spy